MAVSSRATCCRSSVRCSSCPAHSWSSSLCTDASAFLNESSCTATGWLPSAAPILARTRPVTAITELATIACPDALNDRGRRHSRATLAQTRPVVRRTASHNRAAACPAAYGATTTRPRIVTSVPTSCTAAARASTVPVVAAVADGTRQPRRARPPLAVVGCIELPAVVGCIKLPAVVELHRAHSETPRQLDQLPGCCGCGGQTERSSMKLSSSS